MFKRSRKKIILAIMGSLILLFAVTLSVIMLASYREIRQENMEMLKRHVEGKNRPLTRNRVISCRRSIPLPLGKTIRSSRWITGRKRFTARRN